MTGLGAMKHRPARIALPYTDATELNRRHGFGLHRCPSFKQEPLSAQRLDDRKFGPVARASFGLGGWQVGSADWVHGSSLRGCRRRVRLPASEPLEHRA